MVDRRQIAVPKEAFGVNRLRRSRSPISLPGGDRDLSAGACVDRRGGRAQPGGWRGGQGRAVRPARRGSLEGPGRRLSPTTMGSDTSSPPGGHCPC
jgi:hypothetical protein